MPNHSAVKDAVIATMKNVYFIAKEGLPKQLMPALQNLTMLQGCKSLEILKQSQHVQYTSHDSIDGFIEYMAQVVEDDIINKANSSKLYGLTFDESTDISISQNLIIYIRCIVNGKVESHFLSLSALEEGAKAEHIYTEVITVLEQKGLSKSDLICLGTDGTSVMTGIRSGVVTRFKKDNPFILSSHCAAHKLALASGQASATIPYLVKYQDTINSLAKYFEKSVTRQRGLKKAQTALDEKKLKMKEQFSTRWLTFHDSIKAVVECLDSLITTLQSDVN